MKQRNRRTLKPLEELNLMDDFLMNEMTSNPDIGIPFCKEFLPVLLQREVGKLKVTTQKVIPGNEPGKRGIRMDVEIYDYGDSLPQDESAYPATIYDLEPHLKDSIDIIKHNRFYQAKIDAHSLKSGERNFVNLPDLYVITILDYDPFGFDYMMYTVANQCTELPEMDYNDGLSFLYFYTNGTKGGSQEIKDMLNYFQKSNAANAVNTTLKTLHHYVEQVKHSSEGQVSYMRYDDLMREAKYDGRIEGKLEGKYEDILELLEDYGPVPEDLQNRIYEEEDLSTLKIWLKLAAKATSLEDWRKQVNL